MKQNSNKPFSKLSGALIPEGLEARVLARISAARAQSFRMRLFYQSAVALLSASAFVASCAYVWNTLVASGFSGYASIIFSDGTRALAYSKELGLSLAESLPALGIALALVTLLALSWSLSNLFGRRQFFRAI